MFCAPPCCSRARSGGPRKCVGDQFALMEGVVVLAVLLRQYNFELVPGREVRGRLLVGACTG